MSQMFLQACCSAAVDMTTWSRVDIALGCTVLHVSYTLHCGVSLGHGTNLWEILTRLDGRDGRKGMGRTAVHVRSSRDRCDILISDTFIVVNVGEGHLDDNNHNKQYKRQFIRRSSMARVTTRAPCNVRCSYSAKQLLSEVGTREKMRIDHVFKVDNVGAERVCSGRLFQATGPATQNARLYTALLVL